MKPIFLDTGYVIALLHTKDVHHDKAAELAQQLAKDRRPRVTTTGVLLELGDGFARKGRWPILATFLDAALSDPLLEIVAVDVGLTARAIEFRRARQDKDWGLTDCVSFVVMNERDIVEALSADRHFQQAGFRALLLEHQDGEPI